MQLGRRPFQACVAQQRLERFIQPLIPVFHASLDLPIAAQERPQAPPEAIQSGFDSLGRRAKAIGDHGLGSALHVKGKEKFLLLNAQLAGRQGQPPYRVRPLGGILRRFAAFQSREPFARLRVASRISPAPLLPPKMARNQLPGDAEQPGLALHDGVGNSPSGRFATGLLQQIIRLIPVPDAQQQVSIKPLRAALEGQAQPLPFPRRAMPGRGVVNPMQWGLGRRFFHGLGHSHNIHPVAPVLRPRSSWLSIMPDGTGNPRQKWSSAEVGLPWRIILRILVPKEVQFVRVIFQWTTERFLSRKGLKDPPSPLDLFGFSDFAR